MPFSKQGFTRIIVIDVSIGQLDSTKKNLLAAFQSETVFCTQTSGFGNEPDRTADRDTGHLRKCPAAFVDDQIDREVRGLAHPFDLMDEVIYRQSGTHFPLELNQNGSDTGSSVACCGP